MTDPRTAPPYAEEEATEWLAWLAHNMRRRNMTVFQIESLQPDWLAGRRETTFHLRATRMIWGMLSGLIFGLIGGLILGLIFEMRGGMIIGLSVGLNNGGSDIDLPPLSHELDISLRSHGNSTRNLLREMFEHGRRCGVIVVMSVELIVMSVKLVSLVINEGLLGLIGGLIGERIGGMRGGMKSRLIGRWLFGLIFALIFGLIFALINGLINGLIFALINGLVIGLIGGLIGGFQPGTPELKTRPNQGIRLTVRSAFKIGLPIGLIAGIPAWALSRDLIFGLLFGVVVALIVGLWYGGLDAIEHGIIRIIIARRGHAPLNYARFLDYAAEELNFLQKVGGGYVFIHRYLLEHFAEIAVEKGYVPVDDDD